MKLLARAARPMALALTTLTLSTLAAGAVPVTDDGARWKPAARSGGVNAGQVVWVALEDARQVAKVAVKERRVLRRFSVNGGPHNLTLSRTGRTVATALWDTDSIALIRRGHVRHVRLGGAPHDVKIGDGRVVVANQGAARLDLVTVKGKFYRSIALKADPHDLALTRAGDVAWVSLEGSDDMAIVRIEDKSVSYRSTGKAPHDLLFAPDGRLWVTDWHGAVHVFSRRGLRIKTINIGDEAHHLDFTPNGSQVWITDHGAHRVFVLDTETFRVIKRFAIKGAPHHVAITFDGRKAVVADHERGLLVVYSVRALERRYKIEVGAGPHGIWADVVGGTASPVS